MTFSPFIDVCSISNLILSYYPLAARNKRDDLGCDVTAYKCAYGYARNGCHGGQCESGFEHSCPHAQPENVHEIHAVAEFGEIGYHLRRFICLDAGEHEERAGCEHNAVDGAERPAYLKHRCGVDYARNGLDIERQDCYDGADNHERVCSGPGQDSPDSPRSTRACDTRSRNTVPIPRHTSG